MDYELAINNSVIFSGSVIVVTFIIILVIAILAVIAYFFWRRVRESETMRYEFITIIAHKFRTPLTAVKWLLDNMSINETDSQKKENLTDLKDSNEKLIALTGTLVELADLDNQARTVYVWEKTVFCDFVRSVIETYKKAFHEKNIFLSTQCEDPDIVVMIDRSRLEFVLQTLLENACNYTPPGRNVEVAIIGKGRKAVLSVSDGGIGIKQEDLPKIFSKFFRAENARMADTEGIGVGLFLAKSIVTRHHGRIAAYSAGINQGSTFIITLPRARK